MPTSAASISSFALALALGATAWGAEPDHQAPALKSLPTPPAEGHTAAAAFPALGPEEDPAQLGVGVQRTMALLASSTAAHRNHVRVLFYGQSITEQDWSRQVADDLRRRFPLADLEIENRAIGGFASQLLINPAEHDLYPFYPDLVIFHVFGANGQYEQIIKSIRSRTTAEVLMQTDRVGRTWPQDHPDEKADKGLWWDWMMNNRFLPDIAKKYGCALQPVRGGWLRYLKDNHYEPAQLLLPDGTHLNPQGNFVLAQLTERYLVHRPELPDAAWNDLAQTRAVTTADWKDGVLTMEFTGNRVDLIPRPGAHGGGAQVAIDGRKPSGIPEAYRITRPAPGPWSPLFLSRVDHTAPLMQEEWTITVHDVAADGKTWAFDVRGSLTGVDGSGRSDQQFTSPSGRVAIAPGAWFRGFYQPLPEGYQIHWQVLPMAVDAYQMSAEKSAADGLEHATTIVQGLPPGTHVLTLRADTAASPPDLGAIRIYHPPVAP
ncbi:MAG: SGNH/GDSL hydrolase family protein [Planctomycetes bacterium]|nr:SGNH/GDSL hydrolase family protein [Planctomycetota bacterium]